MTPVAVDVVLIAVVTLVALDVVLLELVVSDESGAGLADSWPHAVPSRPMVITEHTRMPLRDRRESKLTE